MDLDARIVERWRPGDERPEIVADELEWQPTGATRSLKVDLHQFFQA